jgi:hypothetical protein
LSLEVPDVPDVLSDVPEVPEEVPEVPDEPDEPMLPDEPDEPEAPDEPEVPDEPDESMLPDEPEVPDEPDEPMLPDEPDEPEAPDDLSPLPPLVPAAASLPGVEPDAPVVLGEVVDEEEPACARMIGSLSVATSAPAPTPCASTTEDADANTTNESDRIVVFNVMNSSLGLEKKLLIREPRDQRLFDSYPKIFAVFHARHRLLTPRHPPCALSSLTTNIQNSPSHNFSQALQPNLPYKTAA